MYRFNKKVGPLYLRVKEDILTKIQRGIWPVGHKLPTEDELVQQYSVSRGTIRQAMSQLELEGYVSRMAAKGTFVTSATKLQKDLNELIAFNEQLLRAGLKPSTKVLARQLIKASQAKGRVIEGFNIAAGSAADTDIIHIKRLKTGGGQPLSIQSVYLLPDLCPGLLDGDMNSLFRIYEERYNRKIMVAHEIIRIAAASGEEAALLQIEQGDPVVIRDRVSYDQDDTPFEVLHSIDRSDKIAYSYTIVNDPTKTPAVSRKDASKETAEKITLI